MPIISYNVRSHLKETSGDKPTGRADPGHSMCRVLWALGKLHIPELFKIKQKNNSKSGTDYFTLQQQHEEEQAEGEGRRRERRKKKRHCLLKGPRRQSTKTVTWTLVLEASAVRQEAKK